MKSNKPSFTLFEVVLVLGLLGIFGAFSGQLLLGIYQNYAHERDNSNAQFRVQIALLQIKRILESAYLQSLQLSTNTALTNDNLLGKSLIFYPKLERFALVGDFAIPCWHGLFAPQSLHFSAQSVSVEFLKLSHIKQCNSAQIASLTTPTIALVLPESFSPPQDFYNPALQGRILSIDLHNIHFEIPQILKNNPKIQPRLYLLDTPNVLHINKEIILESSLLNHAEVLVSDVESFSLKQTMLGESLGFFAKLCLQTQQGIECAESLILEL